MSDDYEINNKKFTEMDDGYAKFLFAIWYAKKNNSISNENCQILKKEFKDMKTKNQFTWKTFLNISNLESYVTNLDVFLETLKEGQENQNDDIKDLSPDSKKILIESTSPNDELIRRNKEKNTKKLKDKMGSFQKINLY